jgi:hypothetical protein
VLQREDTANSEAYHCGQRAREATRHENPGTGAFIRQGNKTEVMDMESAVPATETPIESPQSEVADDIPVMDRKTSWEAITDDCPSHRRSW